MAGAGPSGAHDIGLVMVVGLGVFFVIEKLVLWWHAHSQDEEEGAPRHAHAHHDHGGDRASGVLVLVGDSIHNADDGVLIGEALVGDLTTVLVATHVVEDADSTHRYEFFA